MSMDKLAHCKLIQHQKGQDVTLDFDIVSLKQEEITNDDFVSQYSPLAKAALHAFANNQTTFIIDGINLHCTLISFAVFDKNIIELFKDIGYIDFTKEFETVWIYRGQIGCQRNHHCIEFLNAIVKDLNNNSVTISINHCKDCNLYFIHESSLKAYQKQYGILLFRKNPHESLHEYFDSIDRAAKSPLNLYGYMVKEGSLTESERQHLLSVIIDNEWMDEYSIINYLEVFIAINGESHRNINAVEKWANDLCFVRKYIVKDERIVLGELKHNS